jgi:CheY-like chemotaxis protein
MNNKKILAADDDEEILDVLSIILGSEGYDVTTLVNADEVMAISGDLPDLILLDIWMSGVDGRQICGLLKSRRDTRHIPVILVSANSDIIDIAKDAGADDFICKPFDMHELLVKVAKYCGT